MLSQVLSMRLRARARGEFVGRGGATTLVLAVVALCIVTSSNAAAQQLGPFVVVATQAARMSRRVPVGAKGGTPGVSYTRDSEVPPRASATSRRRHGRRARVARRRRRIRRPARALAVMGAFAIVGAALITADLRASSRRSGPSEGSFVMVATGAYLLGLFGAPALALIPLTIRRARNRRRYRRRRTARISVSGRVSRRGAVMGGQLLF